MKLTSVFRTNQFKRDAKALFKKHYDAAKLADAIEALMQQNRDELRTRYRARTVLSAARTGTPGDQRPNN